VIRASLGSRIGRIWIVRCSLFKKTFITQGSINLIGGNMVKAFTLKIALPSIPKSIKQVNGSNHISAHKGQWIFDAPVNMAFCRKMKHSFKLMLFEDTIHSRTINNILSQEMIVGLVLNIL